MILKLFFPNVLLKRKGFRLRYFSSTLLGNAEVSCHLFGLEKIPEPTGFTHITSIWEQEKLFLQNQNYF